MALVRQGYIRTERLIGDLTVVCNEQRATTWLLAEEGSLAEHESDTETGGNPDVSIAVMSSRGIHNSSPLAFLDLEAGVDSVGEQTEDEDDSELDGELICMSQVQKLTTFCSIFSRRQG